MHAIVDTEGFLMLLAGIALLCAASFALGYQAADRFTVVLIRQLRSQAQQAQRKQHELVQWIKQNWPNAFEAYQNGHRDGYAQGFDNAWVTDEENE